MNTIHATPGDLDKIPLLEPWAVQRDLLTPRNILEPASKLIVLCWRRWTLTEAESLVIRTHVSST